MPIGTRRAKSMPSTPSRKPCTKCCRDCSPSLTMSMPQSSRVLSARSIASRLSFRASARLRSAAERGGVVEARDAGAAVEDLRVARGDLPVQFQERRIHVDARAGLVLEMMKAVFAAHQGRAVLAFELLDRGRDIADRKTDAAIEGRVWRRAVHEPHMVQRHFARAQVERHRLRLIDLDRDLLAAA